MATTYLDLDHTEGYWRIDDDELYYRRFGSGDTVLLGLHGGPGMPHEYLLPLAEHASDRVSVYLYDQFGVGKSDTPAPGDFDRYTVAHYREELEAVRQQIDPDRLILYGQSWGGMLAQEYMLAYGQHVDGVVLANTLADSQTAFESMRRVLDELPEDKQELIAIAEAARDFDDPAYLAALDMAYRQHVCRCDPYPDPVEYTFEHTAMDVYGLIGGTGAIPRPSGRRYTPSLSETFHRLRQGRIFHRFKPKSSQEKRI